MKTIHPSPLLNLALSADVAASGTIAVLQLAAARPLAELLALPQPLLVETGAFLVGWTALLAVLAASARVAPALVGVVIVGNLAWAVACLALLATGTLLPNGLGIAFVLVQAAVVLVLAALQYAGLARSVAAGDVRTAGAR
jgi:hypothetical protein